MKFIQLTLCIVYAFSLAACSDSDMTEDYMANSAKIIAVKITDPEVQPGEQVAMNLLVAGREIDQEMNNTVSWFLADNPPVFLGSSPYNETFLSDVPLNILDQGDDFIDIPILAQIIVDNKPLTGEKRFRVTHTPVGKNPVITEVTCNYKLGEEIHTVSILAGDNIRITDATPSIAFTAITQSLTPPANDLLIYKWYASLSKNSEAWIYVYDDRSEIENVLGPGAKAADFRQSVLYSLKGKDFDDPVQTGIFDIYLVVRDNAQDAQSAADDRLGTDFFQFTLTVEKEDVGE